MSSVAMHGSFSHLVNTRQLGIKKTKLYSCIKSGRIPEPQRLTSRSVCWPESSIKAIVEDIKTGQLVL